MRPPVRPGATIEPVSDDEMLSFPDVESDPVAAAALQELARAEEAAMRERAASMVRAEADARAVADATARARAEERARRQAQERAAEEAARAAAEARAQAQADDLREAEEAFRARAAAEEERRAARLAEVMAAQEAARAARRAEVMAAEEAERAAAAGPLQPASSGASEDDDGVATPAPGAPVEPAPAARRQRARTRTAPAIPEPATTDEPGFVEQPDPAAPEPGPEPVEARPEPIREPVAASRVRTTRSGKGSAGTPAEEAASPPSANDDAGATSTADPAVDGAAGAAEPTTALPVPETAAVVRPGRDRTRTGARARRGQPESALEPGDDAFLPNQPDEERSTIVDRLSDPPAEAQPAPAPADPAPVDRAPADPAPTDQPAPFEPFASEQPADDPGPVRRPRARRVADRREAATPEPPTARQVDSEPKPLPAERAPGRSRSRASRGASDAVALGAGAAGSGVVATTIAGAVASAAAAAVSVTPLVDIGIEAPSGPSPLPEPAAPAAPPSIVAAERAPARAVNREILANGVYVGGTEHMVAGDRYTVAIRDATIEILGPVQVAPNNVVASRDLARLDVVGIGGRLVLTATGREKRSFIVVLDGLAGADAETLERRFARHSIGNGNR